MTEFKKNTATLRAQLEVGDIPLICKDADCVPNTLYSAWSRDNASDLKGKEQDAYNAFVKFVQKKVREKKQLAARAAEVVADLQE